MNRREDGFTVIEVMIAIVILVFGVLAIMSTSMLISRSLGTANRTATAMTYAQEQLETLKGLGCAGATSGNAVQEGIYTMRWAVASVNAGREARIVLETRYPRQPGQMRADTVETSILCVQ